MAFIQKLAYMYVRLFIRLKSFMTIPIKAFSHHIGLRDTSKNIYPWLGEKMWTLKRSITALDLQKVYTMYTY